MHAAVFLVSLIDGRPGRVGGHRGGDAHQFGHRASAWTVS